MSRVRTVGWLLMIGCLLAGSTTAWSQDKNKSSRKNTKAPKAKPQANTRSLDQRADTLVNQYMKETGDVADEYLDAGHPDKAIAVLQRASSINPDDASIKQKISQIQQQNLTANEVLVDVNVASGWDAAGVLVVEGKPFRAIVEGSYRLEMSGSVTSAGLMEKDVTTDLIGGIPTGALMGIVVKGDNKPGKPFAIGLGGDFTPRESGKLMLRINAPAGHRSTGKLKVTLSGGINAG
ncbi:MAG: tetratricopeptide repeat protein [Planctomycetaceae bacterium]